MSNIEKRDSKDDNFLKSAIKATEENTRYSQIDKQKNILKEACVLVDYVEKNNYDFER